MLSRDTYASVITILYYMCMTFRTRRYRTLDDLDVVACSAAQTSLNRQSPIEPLTRSHPSMFLSFPTSGPQHSLKVVRSVYGQRASKIPVSILVTSVSSTARRRMPPYSTSVRNPFTPEKRLNSLHRAFPSGKSASCLVEEGE